MSVGRTDLGPSTLVDVLDRHSRECASQVAYRILSDGEHEDRTLTFQELHAAAQRVAAQIQRRGLAGQPLLILCPTGVEYVIALFACCLAPAVAVPAYPPTRGGTGRVLARIDAIVSDSRAAGALVSAEVAEILDDNRFSATDLLVVEPTTPMPAAPIEATAATATAPINPDTVALIQYTSGSTAIPKGVVITHAQLLANLAMIRDGARLTRHDVVLSWLPPYHDMGLIGGIFTPCYMGIEAVLMPPEAFIRRPKRWLTAAQRYRASALMAPNFAFDLCARRVKPSEREGLDLSSWRVVCNGAEPICERSLRAFTDAFQPHGFRPEAFYPCYGMAEATLIVSGGDPAALPVCRDYLVDALDRNEAVPVSHEAPETRSRRLVGCGRPLLDETIVVVDPDTRHILPQRRVGEIWLTSPSVARGYLQRPDETERVFGGRIAGTNAGPYLRTGDLGFLDAGELFVMGRLKDVIIIRGLNRHAQDIERTVQAVHEALVRDSGAAFGVEVEGSERLIVVQEFDKRSGAHPAKLLHDVPEAIRSAHEITPFALVLVKRGSLLKTSSGKVRRTAMKQAYLSDELDAIARWTAAEPAEPAEPLDVPCPLPLDTQQTSAPHAGAAVLDRSQTRPIAWRQPEQAIVEWLRSQLAQKLRLSPEQIDPDEPLARLGVDSLMAAELTEDLEQWLGHGLSSTISYDNPTIARLAHAIAARPTERTRAPRVAPARARLGSGNEPIAIVGMACRVPGASDLAGFWRLLQQGGDAISEVPSERWDSESLYDPRPGIAGKTCSKWGGFVEGIDQFDADFFGISAREAARMDPQQRIFLESSWEALEHAVQSPTALAGSATGVFVGVCSADYASLYRGDVRFIDADSGTGNASSIVANRLSYVLDLMGPSETIDTACSSSLVAVQHAMTSLRARQCDLAIAGGVNAVLAPEPHVYFSQIRALARDGRCKAFDQRADGFVRGEGVGVLVLKRLPDAVRAGDRIHALIAGGAVNHDGKSNGLLAPNGLAQQALINEALAASGIGPEALQYIEAHGVGTPASDAVELHALGAVMADRDPAEPLLVGSVKTNIGHLEAASGVVGMIKVVLALQNDQIPPHLHLANVHRDIGIERLPIAIAKGGSAWLRRNRPRYAGVSAFGFGGTNAHVILTEAPPVESVRQVGGVTAAERPWLLALSAKTRRALRTLALRFGDHLGGETAESLSDVCFSANTGRAHFAHRLLVSAYTSAEAAGQLSSFGRGTIGGYPRSAELTPGSRPKLAFVFPESQVQSRLYAELHDTHAIFGEVFARGDELLRRHLHHPVSDVLYVLSDAEAAPLLAQPRYAHAAQLLVQWALHSLLGSWGIEPAVVYGAGAGELAAAAAAGVLSWEQALVCATRRGLLLQSLVPGAEQHLTIRQFKAELAALSWQAPERPFESALLARAFAPGEVPDAAHWARHIYYRPESHAGRDAVPASACDLSITLGSTLRTPALAPNGPAWPVPHELVGAAYLAGATIDWSAFPARDGQRKKLALPTYPFERKRHWLDFPQREQTAGGRNDMAAGARGPHPLISRSR